MYTLSYNLYMRLCVCSPPHLVPLRHEKVYTSTRESELQVSFHQPQVCTVP